MAETETPTSTTFGPTKRRDRHRFVDVLRGFALLGILVVNLEYIAQHTEIGYGEYKSPLAQAARWCIATFGQMKIFLLFSLLFGYGLSLQLQRATASTTHLGPRYMRRMFGLVLLGIAHGLLFFPGDILVLYGLIGGAAYLLRNMRTRQLLIIAALTYGAASVGWIVIGLLDAAYGTSKVPNLEALEIFRQGSFSQVLRQHLLDWPWTFIALSVLQGPAIFAAFLVGVVLGRGDLLSNPDAHRGLARRVLAGAGLVGLIGSGIGGALSVHGGNWNTMGFALGFTFGPGLTAAYIAALALLVGGQPSALARPLEFGGRMSLTVYLLESVIATSLVYGYGLGLFGEVGPVAGSALSAAIWLLLCLGSMLWLSRARMGPCERLLRSFTY